MYGHTLAGEAAMDRERAEGRGRRTACREAVRESASNLEYPKWAENRFMGVPAVRSFVRNIFGTWCMSHIL